MNAVLGLVANIVASSIQPLQNISVLVSKKKICCSVVSHFFRPTVVLVFFSQCIAVFDIALLLLLKVQNYIEGKLGPDDRLSWAQTQVTRGLAALEKLLKGHAGKYATGNEIALADLFLAPQIGSTKRFNINMAEFPLLKRLNDAYSDVPAFRNAEPQKQPDAPDDVKSS
ncbi:hypothetical protein Cgig2_017987 [Carnegiea gigantea]|uniref:GST C-terminal domain-containing protein n=1 Tax=Carnegiea gigantea TaxID=171969 RepID=A0A9Q1JS04_9CARY|nr:hypothetical protein Cgig2_017987 [Carnegiea gigantea]